MIAGILLAAGSSRRMGQPKQLLDWHGEPLVRHIARAALAAQLSELVVVLGHEAAAVQAALAGLEVRCVLNERYTTGQASSLQAGLIALPANATATMVLLCDQPLVSTELINTLVQAFEATPAAVALIPRYNGQRGNPVLLSQALFGELAALEGDEGARRVLQRHGERVCWLDSNDAAVVSDVDTLEQYQQLSQRPSEDTAD